MFLLEKKLTATRITFSDCLSGKNELNLPHLRFSNVMGIDQ